MDNFLKQNARMQKAFYDDSPANVEEIVGNVDYHENFPYETHLLHLYGDIRKPVLPDPSSARGFEIGCGEGRMVRRMSRILRSDGCATLQLLFSRRYPYCRTAPPPANEAFLADIHHIDRLHARWTENRWDAAGTDSACDVAFGTDDIPRVLEDFGRWFRQADVWFHDISLGRPDGRGGGRQRVLPEVHSNCHCGDDAWFAHMAFFHLRGPKK
ncbi:hypothetical protein [Massilia sp. BSC265]|uniref:hypothetical protein n=1 Tax=Massilia sp. BSC265 TaxID=1549812 RepID=UPI0004E91105|nr:hypothetical protein [Massilia sp. BSC265]KFI07970.1 hypothetical protein JN27_06935 [Massilia sp. BSC265]